MSCKKRSRRREIEQGGRSVKKRVKLTEGRVNWVNMPEDLMLQIFVKLGALEILLSAQYVCTFWKKLAKEPLLYRAIDFQGAERSTCSVAETKKFVRLAKEAVDRSCGQLVRLSSIEGFGWENIFNHVIKTNSLKSLELRKGTYVTGIYLARFVSGLDLVEELDISFAYFPTEVIEEAGRTCLRLTKVRLSMWIPVEEKFSDKAASTIARNLSQVRHLSLEGFLLTSKGLGTILDGCPYLEHLDLRQCVCYRGIKNLLKRRATKIGDLLPPSKYVKAKRVSGARS